MILSPERLRRDLDGSAVALNHAYLIFGDEPLQRLESADAVRHAATQAGATERIVLNVDSGFDWDEVKVAMSGMSLFGDRQLIEVRLGTRKPDKKGTLVLSELLEQPNGDDILLIQADKLDRQNQKAKWFKAFENHGTVVAEAVDGGRNGRLLPMKMIVIQQYRSGSLS